jgi:hypothetical protein
MAYNKETGMYEGYIYKIYNDINDKIYIGQTIRTVEERWREHLRDSEVFDYCLYKAIRKHEKYNFHIKCVEKLQHINKADLNKNLDRQEMYWINFYNSYKNGYNETIGGQNNAPNKFSEREVIEYDMDCNQLYIYPSITCASDATGFSRSYITSCCLKTKVNRVQNRIFRYIEEPLNEEEIIWYKKRYPKIYQYDFYGNLIKIYEFIQDAVDALKANNLNVIHGNIGACCEGRVLSAAGFVWRKHPDVFNTYQTPKLIEIEKRDLYTGKLLEVFSSFIEIKDKYGYDESTINNCCNKHIHSAYGFHWCYKGKFDKTELLKTQKKIIDQYSLDGVFIKTYDCITDAAHELGIESSSAVSTIGAVCMGKKLTAYGFVWRYHGELFELYDCSTSNRIIKINQYDLDGNFICTYDNSKLAAASVGTTNKTAITDCCKKKRESYKGYKWYYIDDPEQPDKTKIIN